MADGAIPSFSILIYDHIFIVHCLIMHCYTKKVELARIYYSESHSELVHSPVRKIDTRSERALVRTHNTRTKSQVRTRHGSNDMMLVFVYVAVVVLIKNPHFLSHSHLLHKKTDLFCERCSFAFPLQRNGFVFVSNKDTTRQTYVIFCEIPFSDISGDEG